MAHFIHDRKLIPRIRDYLAGLEKPDKAHEDDVADHLRETYRGDYSRKKINEFRKQVGRALTIVRAPANEPPSSKLERIEEDHINKRRKTDNTKVGSEEPAAGSSQSRGGWAGGEQDMNESTELLGATNEAGASGEGEVAAAPWGVDKAPSTGERTPSKPLTGRERREEAREKRGTPGRSKKDRVGGDGVGKSMTGGSFLSYSQSSYADLGGIEGCLQDVRELIEYPLSHPELYGWLGIAPPRGILLHGPPGCGKTLLANAVAGELKVPFLKISAPEIVSGMSGESEGKIRELFEEARSNAPCIVFIDEIDAITPKRENAQREMERRIVAQFLTCMDDLGTVTAAGDSPPPPVLVIGATNRVDSIDAALRRAGRFDREIALGIPDEGARARILKVLTSKMRMAGDFDFALLAKRTPGFVGADLAALSKEAAVIAIHRIFRDLHAFTGAKTEGEAAPENGNGSSEAQPMDVETAQQPATGEGSNVENGTKHISLLAQMKEKEKAIESRQGVSAFLRDQAGPLTPEQLAPLAINMADFVEAVKKVQPSSKREGFATIPDVTWADIGALEDVRADLEMAVLKPIKYPERFAAVGLNVPTGVLLYGPPGCGKTLLAKAVASESGASFISIKGPELLNKYVGESERAIRQVFERAQNSAPCILFFDELDALCPKRSSEGNNAQERLVNQLLTAMDGVEARKQVFVIAATNRPDIIDPAMLRPGRLDRLLYVPLPSAEARVGILQACTRRTPLGSDVVLKEIASSDKCNGFSGADLASLVREAAVCSLKSCPDEEIPEHVTQQHFDMAFDKVTPSVSTKDERMYNSMRESIQKSRSRMG